MKLTIQGSAARQNPIQPVQIVRTINRFAFNHLLPSVLWLWFASIMAGRLIESLENQQDWLITARLAANLTFTFLNSVFFMVRHSRVGPPARPVEIIVAIVGISTPNLIGNLPLRYDSSAVLVAGNLLGTLGLAWSILSIAVLGRCFGILPEARGLVTRGPYRLVRHPLYLGEIIMMLGMLLPVLSPLSFAIWLAAAGLQLWRARYEERALEKSFPQYTDYKSQTRRLIPFVW